MNQEGLLIVLSSPSGTGKTTISRELVKKDNNLVLSVSYTTRPPRKNEETGKDYFFLDKLAFQQKIKENQFLEWAEVHGDHYGSPKEFVETQTAKGKDVVLVIDVQGGRQIKKKYPQGVFIFILPPSLQTLQERLKNRMTEKPEDRDRRIKTATWETRQSKHYDYLVVNDRLSEAVEEVWAIIKAERARVQRRKELIDQWLR